MNPLCVPRRPARTLLTVLLVGFAPALLGQGQPTIRLFPTTVLEDIRQTGEVAQEMETGLQEVINRLDQQQQIYLESKCDGAEGDAGCERITKQLGASYLEMLQIMEQNLPAMEKAVQHTESGLEKRLRQELGLKMSPWNLQENLLGASGATGSDQAVRPSLRGRSGMRLSDRFREYYKLVSHSSGAGDSSLAVVAADIYLDMQETSDLIARTRDEISRATLMEQLNQSLGSITPEMQAVVGGVKSILFGDPVGDLPLAGPPAGSTPETYRSPLMM